MGPNGGCVMRALVAYAEGSPCPTLVLPADWLPSNEAALAAALRPVRRSLAAHGNAKVLKIALVAPSAGRSFDLDYRFVQCLPSDNPRFEFRGSCGHSILAAVLVSAALGWVDPLRPGRTVGVNVRNNADFVECQVDEAAESEAMFTVRFRHRRPPRLDSLLLFGEPVTELPYGGATARVSGVSMGNPYVFVDAAALGWTRVPALFNGGADLFATLSVVRQAAEARLGWRPGTFPKVAALLPVGRGALAARAISVPSWHPTLALTGVTCLGAAAAIPGTVPAQLAGHPGGRLTIHTPGGTTEVSTRATGATGDASLNGVAVSGKVVRLVSEVDVPWPDVGRDRVPAQLIGSRVAS